MVKCPSAVLLNISTLKMPLATLTVTLMDIFFSLFFPLYLNSNSVYQQADLRVLSQEMEKRTY